MNNMISVNNISELRNLTPVTDDQIVFLVSHTPGHFAGGGEILLCENGYNQCGQ